jgi:hypothetical protein
VEQHNRYGYVQRPICGKKKAGSGYSAKNIGFKGIAGDLTNMGTPRF